MSECDICGNERRTRRVIIEGAEINACYVCAPKGSGERARRKVKERAPKKIREKVLVEDWAKRVREAIASKGWGLKEAANALGISESYLRHIEKGDLRPDEKTIRKLEKGLGITISEEEVISTEEEMKAERKKEFTLEEQAVWE